MAASILETVGMGHGHEIGNKMCMNNGNKEFLSMITMQFWVATATKRCKISFQVRGRGDKICFHILQVVTLRNRNIATEIVF